MKRIRPIIDEEGMHCVVTLAKKRVLAIPKLRRDALGIGPGSKVLVEGALSRGPRTGSG